MFCSPTDFDSSVGFGVSSAGDMRLNSEPDADDGSAGFEFEPNRLLLAGADDVAPAVCPNINPDCLGGALAGSACDVVLAG